MKYKSIAIYLLSLASLTACIPMDTPVQMGYLTAPAVEGLQYHTETQSGYTNSEGGFYYLPGETIQFMLGNINLPAVKAAEIITPIDFVDTNLVNNTRVLNIARFLQSLDDDNNPENGIFISQNTKDLAKTLAMDFIKTHVDFDSESNLDNLLIALSLSLIDKATAKQQVEVSLSNLFSGTTFNTTIDDGLNTKDEIILRGLGYLSDELAGQCYQYIAWIYGFFPLVIDICYEGEGTGTVTVNQIQSHMNWSVTRQSGILIEITGALGAVTYIQLDRTDDSKPLLKIERMPIDIDGLPSLITTNTIAEFFLLGIL